MGGLTSVSSAVVAGDHERCDGTSNEKEEEFWLFTTSDGGEIVFSESAYFECDGHGVLDRPAVYVLDEAREAGRWCQLITTLDTPPR